MISGIGFDAINSKVTLQKQEQQTDGFKEALEQASVSKDDEELLAMCQEVESYMISTIYKQMKASTNMGETLVPKGDYEEMFEDFLTDEQSKNMVQAGGIGLADMMYKQLSRTYVE